MALREAASKAETLEQCHCTIQGTWLAKHSRAWFRSSQDWVLLNEHHTKEYVGDYKIQVLFKGGTTMFQTDNGTSIVIKYQLPAKISNKKRNVLL